jgi:transketolase
MDEIVKALDNLKKPNETDKPQAIVANTVKGKGVSFMERNIGWHAGMLSEEDMSRALKDIQDAWDKERGAK